MESKKERKVFLEDLPKIKRGQKQIINWRESVGYRVKGIYESLQFEVEIIDYEPKTQYLYIKYLNKDIFRVHTGNFQECKLGKLLGKITKEFKIQIETHFKDNKRDIIIIDKEYRLCKSNNQNTKYYKYRCNKCGYEGWMLEGDLLKRKGCPCCCNPPQVVVEGVNSIIDTDSWMIKYFQGGYGEAKKYTKCSTTKIYPVCPNCGNIKDKPVAIYSIYTNHSIGCPKCCDGLSFPNKVMFNVLEQLNIDFETEYSPNWIKPKRYDFYFELDDKKYIVEMDGGFHKIDNKMSGRTKEESQEIDDYKDLKATKHNIKVIRVDCKESEIKYIKNNVFNSILNELFDLTKIDWLKCEEFALSSLVKDVCEIKKNNQNLTTTDIEKIVHLEKSTIIKYLKKGNSLGWCYYNPKEEKEKSRKKALVSTIKTCSKPIEIFKNGDSLGVFNSVAELIKQSEELFGVKLISSLISKVIKGERNHHRGFTFKYITK